MLLNDGLKKNLGAEFLLVSHNIVNAAHTMKFFYKIDDLLPLDTQKFRIQWLYENKYISEEDNRYPSSQVYINIIPIFISAVCKVFKSLKSKGIVFKGYDSRVYEEPFTNEIEVDLNTLNYMPIRIL